MARYALKLGNCMESEGVVPLNNSVFNPKMINHTIDIYYFPASPPSRATLLLMKALGIKHNIKVINIMKGEHLKPEFKEMNPLHTIPVINDGDFVLWDSHVIMKYLVDQYAKDDSLFPRDPKKGALVSLRLYFEATVLFPRLVEYCAPVLFHNQQPDPNKAAKFEEALVFLNDLINNNDYVAGESLTIADFSIVAVIATAEAINFDISKHYNIFDWYGRAKSALSNFGYEEINQEGANAFGAAFKPKLNVRQNGKIVVETGALNIIGYIYRSPQHFIIGELYQCLCSCSLFQENNEYYISKMPIDLYYLPGSAPCRGVLLAAKAVGVELNLKVTDLMKGEHLTPEFIKLNPQHTIPTINDNGFVLWESRAIMTYLQNQYGKNDSLYPKDPKKRALVDQRLYFDIGVLYARYGDYYYPVIFAGASYDPAKLDKIKDAFKFLDSFLENQEYVAGNTLTLADLSIVATVSTYEVSNFDISPYKNVAKWYAKVKATAPGYEEANGKNVLIFKQMFDHLSKK